MAKKNVSYVCVGPFCWGKGLTEHEAIRNAKANFPSGLGGAWRYVLFATTDPDARIDDVDGTLWSKKGSTTLVRRYRVKEVQ